MLVARFEAHLCRIWGPLITSWTNEPCLQKANFEYLSGKTQNHAAGSLEEVVENLVKSWESEASHKVDMSQWNTIDHEVYKVQTNGGKVVDGEDAMKMGNYNALMIDCPTYKSCK